ncbi:MAG: NAD(P)/FAD-dependent oxidoreductase [Chthoniobacterales bacterium]
MPIPAQPVLIVGGGPAGLRAAEVAATAGAKVILCEAQPSVGRKFLVAGRGGLNLTHSEPVEKFPARYRAREERWRDLLAEFGPVELQVWASEVGVETYHGTSGRVFPRGQKAAVLLRAWMERLRRLEVDIRTGARLASLRPAGVGWSATLERAEESFSVAAKAVVLALGGASWPDTGSDGSWPQILTGMAVAIAPWVPANCGWEVDWPADLLERAEGLPLKNLTASVGAESVSGELLITRYGLEGGAIYRLGPALREMRSPMITLDLKPQLTAAALHARLAAAPSESNWQRSLKLSPAAAALLQTLFGEETAEPERLVRRVKALPLQLTGPRPIAEAISSAGGICWDELDEMLMLRRCPGLFAAGEMIDWEAPTGGYLLQGCFSTGTRAGRAAARFSNKR